MRTITIKDSTFLESWNNGLVAESIISAAWFNAFIFGGDTNAVLEVSNSNFDEFAGIPAIEWSGTTKMQSSRVRNGSGFLHTSGTATIVNSLFVANEAAQGSQQRLIASHGGSIVLDACSIVAGILECDGRCQELTGPGLIIAQRGGTIALKASAVGVTLHDVGGALVIQETTGGNVTATAGPNPNWIQPVAGQDAAALRTILNQPALLTDAPGLPAAHQPDFYRHNAFIPLPGTADAPGKLINAVTGANTSNILISPIDGTAITTDVFGTPRTGADGTVRNIGAVQSLPPTLLTPLSWSGGSFHFQLKGLYGRVYTIQASRNLSDPDAWADIFPWVPLRQPDGKTNMVDDAAGGIGHRFYRAILQP